MPLKAELFVGNQDFALTEMNQDIAQRVQAIFRSVQHTGFSKNQLQALEDLLLHFLTLELANMQLQIQNKNHPIIKTIETLKKKMQHLEDTVQSQIVVAEQILSETASLPPTKK